MKHLPFFVYGTLLPGQPNYDLVASEISDEAPALFLDGRLYDLGAYPILLEGNGDFVKGVVYSINEIDYQVVLHRLDALEGYNPREPTSGSYRRIERPVKLVDGGEAMAWVYLGKPALVEGAALIESGDWATYSQKKMEKLAGWWTKWRIGKSE